MSNEKMLNALRYVRRSQFIEGDRLLTDADLEEIALRYGPFYSEEEVRVMLEEVSQLHRQHPLLHEKIDQILTRHTEADGDDIKVGYTATDGEKSEVVSHDRALLHAVAKRLLADGHSENCTKVAFIHADGHELECDCYHDELRRMEGPE